MFKHLMAEIIPNARPIVLSGTICGIGAFFASLFGGWSSDVITLLIFMGADFFTGLAVAAFFKKSKKTESGALSSAEGLKGLFKKGAMLLLVLIGARLDITLGLECIRTAVVLALIVNELISLTENIGLMGVPIPAPIAKAIDLLKNNESEEKSNE
jgi:toxin secretion/phage lysis holin